LAHDQPRRRSVFDRPESGDRGSEGSQVPAQSGLWPIASSTSRVAGGQSLPSSCRCSSCRASGPRDTTSPAMQPPASPVAEAEGFEPSRELPPYTLSRRVPSTARPSLRRAVYAAAAAPVPEFGRRHRLWRQGWDSNPWMPCDINGFRGRQPTLTLPRATQPSPIYAGQILSTESRRLALPNHAQRRAVEVR
jgi:hypothetical protein